MGRARTIHIPFVEGQREDIDPKLLPAGYLTRAKNVRQRKDGRWGVRYGDTALALTTNVPNDLHATQLLAFDDRLFALGNNFIGATVGPLDAFEYVNQSDFAWTPTDQEGVNNRILPVTGVRDMGRPQSQSNSVTLMDCAATGGLVCMVYQTSSSTRVHIFRAADDSTVLVDILQITSPRVVAVGNTFFIGGIDGTTIELWTYDTSADALLQQQTDIFSSGNAIVHWDFNDNGLDTGAWAVVHRSGPTTSVKELDAAGAVISTFAGPATAFSFVSICQTATRVHLAVVATSDSEVDLYSYTLAGALSLGPTAVNAGGTNDGQVGITSMTTAGGTERVGVFAQDIATPGGYDVFANIFTVSTHALSGSALYEQSRLSAKPISKLQPSADLYVYGTVQTTGSFASNNLVMGLGTRATAIAAAKDLFAAGTPALAHLPRIGKDLTTGKAYWPNLVVDKDGRQTPFVSEFSFAEDSQRQTVDMGGLLYIFGAAPQAHDSRAIAEAAYQETPVIYNIAASNGGGSLPSSTTLSVAILWRYYDARGFLQESQLSEVKTVTMGASDDTITFNASSPHTRRNNWTSSITGGHVEIVAFRSVAGKKQLRRCASASAGGGSTAAAVAFTLLASDATIATAEVIYTQGGRGGLGDMLEHEAPLPADFACRFGKRILSAGGPNPYQWQVSKPEFPSEPINWSGDPAFLGTIPDRIRGVAAQDLNGYIFSRSAVYVITGEGPDDTGQGKYSDPAELPSAIGLHDARSIVITPIGIMYQADTNKLFLLPRGGGEPFWFGGAVRDTLRAFPVITAATLAPQEQLVTFACSNTGGTDGRLIHYDLRGKVWIVDEFDGSTPITSVAEYQGRLARLSEGVITLANETHPAAAFIDHSLITGPVCIDWCKLVNITLLGEFRGNCTVTCLVSYDHGKTWTTLKAFQLSTAGGYTAGDAVSLQWWPRRRKGDRFMFEFRVTALAGAASEGFVWNEATIAILPKNGEKRVAAGKRG